MTSAHVFYRTWGVDCFYIFLLCDVLMNAYIWVQIWQIFGVNHPWGIERCSFVKLNLFLVANGVFVQVMTSIFFFDGKSSFVAADCFGKRIKQKQNKTKKEKENNNQTIEFIKFSSNGGLSLFWTFWQWKVLLHALFVHFYVQLTCNHVYNLLIFIRTKSVALINCYLIAIDEDYW